MSPHRPQGPGRYLRRREEGPWYPGVPRILSHLFHPFPLAPEGSLRYRLSWLPTRPVRRLRPHVNRMRIRHRHQSPRQSLCLQSPRSPRSTRILSMLKLPKDLSHLVQLCLQPLPTPSCRHRLPTRLYARRSRIQLRWSNSHGERCSYRKISVLIGVNFSLGTPI